MKKWQAFALIALLLAILALAARLWLPPLLAFAGANSEVIQALDGLAQIALALAAVLAGIYAFLTRRQDRGPAVTPPPPAQTTRVDTRGGAFIGGDVDTGGGKFVGRDNNVSASEGGVASGGDMTGNLIITADNVQVGEVAGQVWRGAKIKLSADALQAATTSYLQYILDRHSYLNMKGMGPSDRVALKLALLDLYVPLQARLELPEGETWQRSLTLAGRRLDQGEEHDGELPEGALRLGEPQPVLDLLQAHDGLVILGDPGAGKTTFLKFLALRLARGEGRELGLEGRLPILLPLAAYANALQGQDVRLDDFIAGYFNDIGSDLPVGEMLAEALQNGRALILLDGLDEVRELTLRNTVVERVTDFYAFHRQRKNKFVLTSRVVGYRQVRPAAEGLAESTLVDFDDAEIEDFVTRWTVALERQAQGDTFVARRDAEQERRELLSAVQNNAGVRRLAANPLLLTILALMKRQGVTLPERRVQLYDQYVTTLLSTWNRARSLSGRAPGRDLDEIQTIRILAPLALWMHQTNPGVGLTKREDLHRKLGQLFAERGEADPEAATRQFLGDVREHAALLLERGPEEYGFIHLTFEEYLAAVAVALLGQGDCRPIVDLLAAHIGEQAWREVSLLTVSYLGIRQQLPKVAGEVAEALAAAKQGAPGEAAVLAGEAVLDAWPGGVLPQSRDKVVEALVPALQNAEAAPEVRRRAGLTLGRLGWVPADLDDFVEIPAGKFLYGDDKEEREIPYNYWVAKYPVTNLQYARFMAAGGYERDELWSKDGWGWRTGKVDSRATKSEKEWISRRSLEERDRPTYWESPRFGTPLTPVVGVTWFEAEAYCRWLDGGELAIAKPEGYLARLTGEEEWEYAARGADGREYPWEGDFDFARANVAKELGEGVGPTAVCTYPPGRSPFGVWDLSGNVFEWTASWVGEKGRHRALRGGSWIGDHRVARCAYRGGLIPDDFYNFIGFRVLVSPPQRPQGA